MFAAKSQKIYNRLANRFHSFDFNDGTAPKGKTLIFMKYTDEIPELERLSRCIQCGTCSGSCPLTERMDYAPRALFALILEDRWDKVLASDTPWYCVSCYQCLVRCPQEIPVAAIMYGLKRLSVSQDKAPINHKIPDLYRSAITEMSVAGKINEARLMARYGLHHPTDIIRNTPTAVKLLLRGRLDLNIIEKSPD